MSKCYDRTGRDHVCPATMHAWARGRWASYTASMNPNQHQLDHEWIDEKMKEAEEELKPEKTALQEWAEIQKGNHGFKGSEE